MVKKLKILEYRKLINISFECDKNMNVISGANGTCKSSILHIISNSFQKVESNTVSIEGNKSLNIIRKINKLMNPKLETLTKKEYRDVANKPGILYECEYFNELKLEFRRHNSKSKNMKNRFSIKPKYTKGGNESLPSLPVIYLGLFRLFAFGELEDEKKITKINSKLPSNYLTELQKLYKEFTGVEINYNDANNMGDIKNRINFTTNNEAIDSNTISAGEDNLLIILTALVSLRYYYESIDSKNSIESLFLIDEIDATLHPTYQAMLYDLIKKYSQEYKIQVFFTTHSLSLLEHILKYKGKLFYLLENAGRVTSMEDLSIYRIEMLLKNKLRNEALTFRNIPVWMEDDEARFFLDLIFEDVINKNEKMRLPLSFFHMPETKMSGDILKKIFRDDKLLLSNMGSICILDGDKQFTDLDKHIISLPAWGGLSPELTAFKQVLRKYESQDHEFWGIEAIHIEGYTTEYFRTNIKDTVENIIKNPDREKSKREFNFHKKLYAYALKSWIEENEKKVDDFLKNLRITFLRVAPYQKIDKNVWP